MLRTRERVEGRVLRVGGIAGWVRMGGPAKILVQWSVQGWRGVLRVVGHLVRRVASSGHRHPRWVPYREPMIEITYVT
jgi:hypothetical protein